MKAINCDKCRKRMLETAKEAYLKQQYDIYKDTVYSAVVFSTAALLGTLYRRGRSKKYIQQMFKDICFMYQFPKVAGKSLTLTNLIQTLEEECGINFDEIKVNIETEKEFITSAKKGVQKL